VRGLATRASSAAKEIKALIESSLVLVRENARQADEANATMKNVQQAIRKVSDIVGEISTASAEQSRGIEQVNEAVHQMDEMTQQNAALVEQAAASAHAMQEQAIGLAKTVSAFNLQDERR
jgi:methyl-accepting chemotaxis protein